MTERIDISYIKYDHDEPHAMQMVWNTWVVEKDHLGEAVLDVIKDQWIIGQHRLAIPQMEWTKIVVNQL